MFPRRRRQATQRYENLNANARAAVIETAHDIIEQGAARLVEDRDGGGHFVRLEPASPRACEVTVYLDGWPTVALGAEGHTIELFGPDRDRLRELRQLIRAVIDGHFEWRYRQVTRRVLGLRVGPYTQLVGTFDTPDGPWTFTRERK